MSNSKNPKIEPTLIEVCVSHPCDESKRNSGLRIIEIRIKKEADAIEIEKAKAICETRFASKRERKVEFISFKRDIYIPHQIKLQRYVINSKQTPNGYFTTINCNKAHCKLRKDSMIELNVVNVNDYKDCDIWEVLLWLSKQKGLRRCNICKFYYATLYEEYPICRLS